MNNDLISSFINSVWKIIAGPILLIAIPLFMTSIEQGYWYTFTSIAALAIFADLGFTTIILQFVAHEFAHLRFSENNVIYGDDYHLWRLSSFFRFVLSWLCKVEMIIFPIILVVGYFFLSTKGDNVDWQLPWIIYALSSAAVFFNSALLSFFEGCNSVGLLQKIRFKISLVSTLITLCFLYFGWNIYSLAFSLMGNFFVGQFFIIKFFYKPIKQMLFITSSERYNWWPEFSALIWRYAISWSSGYLIFQMFTPLAFFFHGAEFAGKVGISIAMWTAGFTVSNTWMTAINPRLNMLIAMRNWQELDRIFNQGLIRSMVTMIVGGCGYFIVYFMLAEHVRFFERVLSPFVMAILFISWIMQLYINTLAIYLRAHKKEPLMFLSFISGIYIAITTFFCAIYFPSDYLFLGFLSSYAFCLPITYKIWKKQKYAHMKDFNKQEVDE